MEDGSGLLSPRGMLAAVKSGDGVLGASRVVFGVYGGGVKFGAGPSLSDDAGVAEFCWR
jgi:hypothetical protein